ncbi:MAG: hypothetical protein K0R63_1736 [Rickettsiales bacterium]|jgi:hypothetical protein|nr:hypothetical protein [Rickettsiales bacterium]
MLFERLTRKAIPLKRSVKKTLRRTALVSLLSLPACTSLNQPEPYGLTTGMIDGAPSGTPGFRSGWKDGCQSGMAAYGSLQYKVAYGYKYDVAMLDNDEYHGAWELGFRHCRWYTNNWTS